jgi:ketosteroid isomerase-like protein
MDLANMRRQGVRNLIAFCLNDACRHQALIEGKDAIHSYFARLANSGDKVSVEASKVIVLHDDVAYVTGLYTFGGVRHGQARTTQAAFTMCKNRYSTPRTLSDEGAHRG